MRSSFMGLEVSKRSIQVSQKALDITNNNLSNIATEGYTRQRVDQNSTFLSVTGKYATKLSRLSLAGQGTNAFGVDQIRDTYVDKRYREYTAYVAEYDTKASVIGEVEDILSDVADTGLIKNLEELKSAFAAYAGDHPDNAELSSVVRNCAYSVCKVLNSYSTQMKNLLDENVIQLENSVYEVNKLIDKIVQYNGVIVGEYNITAADRIYYGEPVVDSYGPNELIDSRNLLLDELSYYGNITVTENNDGSVKVKMGDTVIIDGTKSEHVVMKDYYDYSAAVLKFTNNDDVKLKSGDLKAYTDVLSGNGSYANYYQNNEYGIPYYISTLDAFAQSFSSLMNGLNGCTDDDTTRAMFASSDDKYDDDGNLISRGVITAGNIRISDEWMKDSKMIGQTFNEETGKWELTNLDGSNVNKLYLGMDDKISVGRAGEFYGSVYDYCLFVDNRFAESVSLFKKQYELYSDNASSILDTRNSISGVSETEEGINMLTYQKWYNASSRMMTTLDDCLDRLINSTGRVGL